MPNDGILIDYGNIHSSRLNYKTGFEYDFTDRTMGYATVATAYKQGGFFDGDQLVTNNTYKPEDVISYEIGYKARFLNNHLQTNWAVFTYRYKNFQVSDTTSQDITETYNAQLAKNTGIEMELDWLPTANDRISGSLTWLHARYADFILPIVDEYGRSSYTGNTLPNAPALGANLNYDHIFPLANDMQVELNALVHWQSGEYLDFRDLSGAYQGAYSRSDLNLSYGRGDGKYKFTAFVRNLEDHAILATVNVPAPGGQYTGTLMTPRTFGLRIDMKL